MLTLKSLSLLKLSCLSLVILFTGCNSSSDEADQYTEEIAVISSHPAPYIGAFFTTVGYNMELESGQQHLASWIRDFTFRWGYEVTARIEIVTYAEPEEDSSMYGYRLLEVLETTEDEIGTAYNYDWIFLDAEHIFQPDEDHQGYYLFLGHSFVCADNIDCDQLVAMSNDGGVISVQFEYLGQSNERPAAVMLTDWN